MRYLRDIVGDTISKLSLHRMLEALFGGSSSDKRSGEFTPLPSRRTKMTKAPSRRCHCKALLPLLLLGVAFCWAGWGMTAAYADPVPPSVEIQVQQITDTTGTPKIAFQPGEMVRIWLQATNTGDPVEASLSLSICHNQSAPPYAYDSATAGQNQHGTLSSDVPASFCFDWTVPTDARAGWYDLLGVARDVAAPELVLDDTQADAAISSLGESAWLVNQFEVLAPTGGLVCYRGLFHAHSVYSDGGNIPQNMYPAAQAGGLDGYAVSDHNQQLSDAEWTSLGNTAAQATQEGQFIGLRGFEWTYTYSATGSHGSTYGQGHSNVLNSAELLGLPDYSALGRPPTAAEARADLGVYYEWVAQAAGRDGLPVVAQFNHPSGRSSTYRFENYQPPGWIAPGLRAAVIDRFALMEIGTGTWAWIYTGPFTDPGDGLTNDRLFKLALNNGWKVAPVISEDNHTGTTVFTNHRTGLWAETLTNGGLLNALHSRRFFASENLNFELFFSAAGQPMGSTLTVPEGATVTFRIDWQDPDDQVASVWLVQKPDQETSLSLVDCDLAEDSLFVSQTVCGGEWYFVRVRLQNGDYIYSAPIWIAPTQPMIATAGLDKNLLSG